jgi:multidrug resistance efflux pump
MTSNTSTNTLAWSRGVIDYPVIPRISGAIFRQLYKEGSYVQKDQPLYEIDKRPYLFALQTFEGSIKRTRRPWTTTRSFMTVTPA